MRKYKHFIWKLIFLKIITVIRSIVRDAYIETSKYTIFITILISCGSYKYIYFTKHKIKGKYKLVQTKSINKI